jgi:hypothetical protein
MCWGLSYRKPREERANEAQQQVPAATEDEMWRLEEYRRGQLDQRYRGEPKP